MKSKTSISVNYIFFQNPTHYLIILLPLFTGTIAAFLSPMSFEISDNIFNEIDNQNDQILRNFLFASKFVLAIMLSFYISYKWVAMERDGSYGFWLALRVKRESFLVRSLLIFFLDGFIGISVGILLLLLIFGNILALPQVLSLILLLLVNILMITTLAILIGELLPDQETATIFFLGIFSFNHFFDYDSSSIIHKITKSDLHYSDSNFMLSLGLAFAFTIGLIGLSLFLHKRKGIEI